MNLQHIKRVLSESDPEGLIKMGAPSSEYDSEAHMIAERVCPGMPVSQLSRIIWDIFYEQFHTGTTSQGMPWTTDRVEVERRVPFDFYDAIAERILFDL